MFPEKRKQEMLRLALEHLGKCIVCGEKHKEKNINLFNQDDKTQLAHISCLGCGTNFFAAIILTGHGTSTVGTLTDLSFYDIKRLYKQPKIKLDEVLEACDFLNNNKFKLKVI